MITSKTGRRKVYYPDDLTYLQNDQRRYLCKVTIVTHERYINTHGRPETRCSIKAQVIQN